jgi:hypothetical protein
MSFPTQERNRLEHYAQVVIDSCKTPFPITPETLAKALNGSFVLKKEGVDFSEIHIKDNKSFTIILGNCEVDTQRQKMILLGSLFLFGGFLTHNWKELITTRHPNWGFVYWKAHYFAECLTMPKSQFKAKAAEHCDGVTYNLKAIGEYFGVSPQRVRNRGAELLMWHKE